MTFVFQSQQGFSFARCYCRRLNLVKSLFGRVLVLVNNHDAIFYDWYTSPFTTLVDCRIHFMKYSKSVKGYRNCGQLKQCSPLAPALCFLALSMCSAKMARSSRWACERSSYWRTVYCYTPRGMTRHSFQYLSFQSLRHIDTGFGTYRLWARSNWRCRRCRLLSDRSVPKQLVLYSRRV